MTIYHGKHERYVKDGVVTDDEMEAVKAAREGLDGTSRDMTPADYAALDNDPSGPGGEFFPQTDVKGAVRKSLMDKFAAKAAPNNGELPPDQTPNWKQGPAFDGSSPPVPVNRSGGMPPVREPGGATASMGPSAGAQLRSKKSPSLNAQWNGPPGELSAAKAAPDEAAPVDGSQLQSREPPPAQEPNASYDDGVSQAQKIGGASDPGVEAEAASNEPSSDTPDGPPPNVQATGQPARDQTLKDLVSQWIQQKKPKDNSGFLAAMSQLERAGEGLAGNQHTPSYIDNRLKANEQEGKDWESEQAKRQALVQEYARQKWQTDENGLNRDAETGRANTAEKNRQSAALLSEQNRRERQDKALKNSRRNADVMAGTRVDLANESAADKGLKDMTKQPTVQAANDVQSMLDQYPEGKLPGFDRMANTAEGLPGFVGQAAGSAVRGLEGPEAQKNAAIVDRFLNQTIADQSGKTVTGNELYRQYMASGRGKFQGEALTRWALQQTIKAFKDSDQRRLSSMRPGARDLVQNQRPGALPQYSEGNSLDGQFEGD